LGPTHEEIITHIVSGEVGSYKDLPLILYQIQNKFRDEVRPRFGVVRSCEFIMKDAYSFDVNEEAMEKSYETMYKAYIRIFERCGLDYIPVEADSGMMGGAGSHEFMVPCEIGEDKIVVCDTCGYSASSEVAEVKEMNTINEKANKEKIETVSTPNLTTVEEVSTFMKVTPDKLIKTLIYIADGKPIIVLVRGDHEAHEIKIKKQLGIENLVLADEKTIIEVTGSTIGFSGPVGLKGAKIFADFSIKGILNGVCGANKKDEHYKNVNCDVDFKVDKFIDGRCITEDDRCPKCTSKIKIKSAIEIGHTFKLGTKYTKALNATYLDADGKEQTIIMGCYGIGVNRILASLIETSYDDGGIIWPMSICPCQVSIIPIKYEDKEIKEVSDKIYEELVSLGVDVILDDRDKTPGVKFKDSDLVGFPVQVVVGKKGLLQEKIEVKIRKTGKTEMVSIKEVSSFVRDLVNEKN